MDRADEVETGVVLRRQLDRYFALAEFGFSF
jgi:hypothetical protein